MLTQGGRSARRFCRLVLWGMVGPRPGMGQGDSRQTMLLFIEQCLNGLQLGLLLFLLAAGLTLVFGIMDLVNLAHGSLYMVGAYFAATFAAWTGSFVLGAVLALVATLLVGMAVEIVVMRRLYGRDHLDHVLATFGLILFFDEAGAADLGTGRHEPAAAVLAQYLGADPAGHPVFRLQVLHHRGDARRGGLPLRAGDAHPHRHADPRRRLQPRNGRRARRQHQAACSRWCSAWAPRSPGLPA